MFSWSQQMRGCADRSHKASLQRAGWPPPGMISPLYSPPYCPTSHLPALPSTLSSPPESDVPLELGQRQRRQRPPQAAAHQVAGAHGASRPAAPPFPPRPLYLCAPRPADHLCIGGPHGQHVLLVRDAGPPALALLGGSFSQADLGRWASF